MDGAVSRPLLTPEAMSHVCLVKFADGVIYGLVSAQGALFLSYATPATLALAQWVHTSLCCQVLLPLPPWDTTSPLVLKSTTSVSSPIRRHPKLLGLVILLGNQEQLGKPYSILLCPNHSV